MGHLNCIGGMFVRVLDCTVVVWKEQEGYVSKCPELGIASCGDTISDAVKNLREAVELKRNSRHI